MKHTVLVCLTIDADTGGIDRGAPFMVIARQAYRSRLYSDEPEVLAQLLPGERQGRFEAEWTGAGWKFGKRVVDAWEVSHGA